MPKRNFKELLCTFTGMKCVESLPADCFTYRIVMLQSVYPMRYLFYQVYTGYSFQ